MILPIAAATLLTLKFKIQEYIYLIEFLWWRKLPCGANKYVTNAKWAQLEPAAGQKDNREDSHKQIHPAFIVVRSTTHNFTCGLIKVCQVESWTCLTCSTCYLTAKQLSWFPLPTQYLHCAHRPACGLLYHYNHWSKTVQALPPLCYPNTSSLFMGSTRPLKVCCSIMRKLVSSMSQRHLIGLRSVKSGGWGNASNSSHVLQTIPEQICSMSGHIILLCKLRRYFLYRAPRSNSHKVYIIIIIIICLVFY